MNTPTASPQPSRLGLHYYPDAHHYRQSDLETWLPELHGLGAGWLVLQAPTGRAIPENFLRNLLQAQIQPLLHFPLGFTGALPELATLFHSYASWGVRYVVLFDRPNLRTAWGSSAWAQADLVENFLDRYLPVADLALEEGLVPVFPPLEPGGDYWDTAFLRRALQSLQRRRRARLLDSLTLGAIAWSGSHPLHWGAGGPERWPTSRPYATPPGAQDQRGFRIFDWYLPLIEAELGSPRPLFLLQAGCDPLTPQPRGLQQPSVPNPAVSNRAQPLTSQTSAAPSLPIPAPGPETLELAALALAEPAEDGLPAQVLACCFWLLTAPSGHPAAAHAWFPPVEAGEAAPGAAVSGAAVSGAFVPALRALVQEQAARNASPASNSSPSPSPANPNPQFVQSAAPAIPPPRLAHYLLLPRFAWGAAAFSLDAVLALFPNTHPTLGFSLDEARLAARVTVFGGEGAYPGAALDWLRAAGCQVERSEDLAQNLHISV